MAKYFKGIGGVWDPERNKMLVDFTEAPYGILLIEDDRTIGLLEKNGFIAVDAPIASPAPAGKLDTQDGDTGTGSDPASNVPGWNETRAKAKSLGIKLQGKTKDVLLQEITEIEGKNASQSQGTPDPSGAPSGSIDTELVPS